MLNPESLPTSRREIHQASNGRLVVRHKMPIQRIWDRLIEADEDPITLVKYFVGLRGNRLSEIAMQQGIPEGSFYVDPEGPIEMGYIWFRPKEGAKGNENMADPRAMLHAHGKCVESFTVIQGRVDLLVGASSKTVRLPGIASISERYAQTDGDHVILRADRDIGPQQYVVRANNYHNLTYASPDTKLLLVKSPIPGFEDAPDWPDSTIHPCELQTGQSA